MTHPTMMVLMIATYQFQKKALKMLHQRRRHQQAIASIQSQNKASLVKLHQQVLIRLISTIKVKDLQSKMALH